MTNEGRSSRRRLMYSNALDAFSRSTTDVVLDIVFVTVLGASAIQMGVLNALGSLAFMVAGIPIGYLVDKIGAIPSLRASLVIKCSALLVLTVLLVNDSLSILIGFSLAFSVGVTGAFTETSQVSTVPCVIPRGTPKSRKSETSHLVSRLSSADEAVGVVAPVVAGALVVAAGAGFTTAIAVGAVLAAFVLALGIVRVEKTEPGSFEEPARELGHRTSGASNHSSFWAGMRYLIQHKRLLAITLLVTLSNAGLAIGSSVEALLILNRLELSEAQFGALVSIGGAGGLLGATIAAPTSRRVAPSKLVPFVGAIQICSASLLIAAYYGPLDAAFWILATQSLTWGIAVVLFNVVTMSWATSLIPEKLIGRTTAARRTMTFGCIPLASVIGGALGTEFGILIPLLLWPILIATGLVVFYFINKR